LIKKRAHERNTAVRHILKTFALLGALSETLLPAWTHAGRCTSKIAQFERAVRQSAGNPNVGPVAPQSIGTQLDRQPTPALIKRAQERAQAMFYAMLARAKRLDAQGNRTGRMRAWAAK
jgi:hypothetical protein